MRLFTDRHGQSVTTAAPPEDVAEVLLSSLVVGDRGSSGLLGRMQVVGRARAGRVLAAGAGEEVGAMPWEKVVELMAVNRLIAPRSELSIRELGRWNGLDGQF